MLMINPNTMNTHRPDSAGIPNNLSLLIGYPP
jgi:hypothetical protein